MSLLVLLLASFRLLSLLWRFRLGEVDNEASLVDDLIVPDDPGVILRPRFLSGVVKLSMTTRRLYCCISL